jgi:hypothetical protein
LPIIIFNIRINARFTFPTSFVVESLGCTPKPPRSIDGSFDGFSPTGRELC